MKIPRWLLVGITWACWVSGVSAAAPGAVSSSSPPPLFDLTGPEFNPPDCPAWAKETLPGWLAPHVGRNGLPTQWRPRNMLGASVRGIDRYQANQFVYFRAETAAYLDKEYTPLTVNYQTGTLPNYEKLAAQFTKGVKNDTAKAVALLLAMPKFFRHPGMPPLGAPARPDRNLEDEPLLASGSGWCNEQARVFIRLCQVSGIPARMVHLFGQNHTVAEFHADGRWALADTSNFFVVPNPAAGTNSTGPRLLSAAQCHDRGPGQRAYAEARQRRGQEMLALSDAELGFTTAAPAVKWRAAESKLSVDELAKREVGFGVINVPLPR